MKLGEIDLNLKPNKASLSLCKPNRDVIHSLKDVYKLQYSIKLGKVNELNFTIPTMIERNHEFIENPLVKKIKDRYLVKLEYNGQLDYLVFLEENKSFEDGGENISYRLYSEGYLLADKMIRDYEVTSKSLSYMLSEILEMTNWKVGFVDTYFDTIFRSHEITSQTVLQAVYELAEKFNAVIIWDTVNFTIDFYNPSNVGMNRGLRFKEGKYLESFNVTTNAEEIVTRLKVYGQDGLTIRRLTPTGVNYLEDFSWFTFPFERDGRGVVIKSSDYMSDSLCIALEDYNQRLQDAQGQFDTYVEQVTLRQDEKQQLEQQLSDLEIELKEFQDEIDVLNASGNSGTPEHATAISNRDSKLGQVNAKKADISNKQVDIDILDADWDALRATLVIEANLSADNMLELNKYIIEKEHSNDTIIDDEDLLKEGMDAFNQARTPKVSLSMNIINFLSVVESQNDWNKLYLGDIVTTESKRLDVKIEAKIIEIDYDFEGDSISLVIANEQDIKDDSSKWLDQLYNAGQTSTQVSMNKYKWDLIEEANSVVSQILNTAWDANKREILAGYQQNITINDRGIVIKSPSNPLDMLVIQSGVLAISNDGGNTFKNAVTRDGIIGDRIVGRILMGTQLIIEDEDGIIRLSGSVQEIFDDAGNLRVAIGNYATGKYGMQINSGSLEIIGGLPKSQIDATAVSKWDSAEANAKSYADGLKTQTNQEIADVNTAITDFQTEVNGAFKDGVIQESEATAINLYSKSLSTEKEDLDKRYLIIYADAQLTGATKTNLTSAKSSFDTAHTNLVNSISTAIADGKATSQERADVDAKFAIYSASLSTLAERLEEAIRTIETGKAANAESNAKQYADDAIALVNTDITDVSSRVTDLNTYVDGAFSDGIIEESEAKAIEKYLNSIKVEKSDIDSRYNAIYSEALLTGTVKTALGGAKTSYDSSYNSLLNSVTNAVTDGKATVTEKNDVDTKFASHQTSLSSLSTAFEDAIRFIETAKADLAEANSKGYTDGQLVSVNASISTLQTDVSDLQSQVEAGFADGVIDQTEAISIEKYINELNMSKQSVLNQYNTVIADGSLTGSPAQNLTSSHTAFVTAHDNLVNSINAAIADGKATPTEKTDVDTKFGAYNTAIASFQEKLQAAILSIQTVKANNAEQNAKDYGDSLDSTIRANLKLTAPLPTSIALDGSGITAYTADASKYARMDYRGLYIQGGAIDIRTSSLTNRGVVLDGNGIRAYNSSGTKTFEVDTNGYLTATSGTFSGSLNGASGTFSGNLSAAGGTFTGTLSGVNGTFTGSISASQITSGGTITGVTISGGSITSNSTINVTTSAYIGDKIFFSYDYAKRFDEKGIVMYDGALSGNSAYDCRIVGTYLKMDIISDTVRINGKSIVDITTPQTRFMGGSVDFSGATVTGLTVDYASTAGNANTLQGFSASNFSVSGHTHSNSQYVMPYTGQSLKLWRSGTKVRVYDGSSYTELTGITG